MNTGAAEIHEIGNTGTVNVCETDALLIKQLRLVHQWRVIHRHFRPKPSVAKIGPVAHFAVANADEIRQPITGHVREVNGLSAVAKDESWSFLFVERFVNTFGRTEAFLGT